MSTVFIRSLIFKSIFIQNSENYSLLSVNGLNFCAVKRGYKMKNYFKFKNEIQQINNIYGIEGQIVSGNLRLDQNLPVETSKSSERKNVTKNMKPSLKYHGEILFGIHPVYLALLKKKRTFHRLFINKDEESLKKSSAKRDIINMAESLAIPVSYVDYKGLKILAPGVVHQGVCLDAGFLTLRNWDKDDFENESSEKLPLWLVLDELLDPMNVGAVIRSSNYFGVNKIFTVIGNSCKLSPTVSKASSGALEVMDLYQIDNLENFIMHAKSKNWSIISTLAYSENQPDCNKLLIDTEEFTLTKPTILILGNEGRGVSEIIKELCDSFISIKPGQNLHQGIDSLNVSVAAGVILYALNKTKIERR